jgi:hypothetical protein
MILQSTKTNRAQSVVSLRATLRDLTQLLAGDEWQTNSRIVIASESFVA